MAGAWILGSAIVGLLLGMKYRVPVALAASLIAAIVGVLLDVKTGWAAAAFSGAAAWFALQASYFFGAAGKMFVMRNRTEKR